MSAPVKTIFIELRASADRLKSDMADAGTALDRIGTGGAEAGRKVSAGVAAASESLGKLARAAVEAGVAVEGIIIAGAKYSGVAAASAGNTEGLVNSWRGLRIALDPSVFTVATVAIGILAEQTVRLTLARAKLIEQQSLIAARGGLSLGAVEHADTVASIAGGGANANTIRSLQEALQSRSATNPLAVDSGLGMLGISGSAGDPDILAKIAQGFASIEDPAKRAQAAVRLFGENNAGAALEQLNGRFAAASDAAMRFGLGLNATARTQIYQFRKDILSLAEPFVFLEENIKAGGKSIGETLAQMAGAADDLAHRLNRALGSGGNTLLQNLTGARPQGPSALTPAELSAPNQRLSPGGQIQQGLQADELFAQQQVAAINKQNSTAAGQRTLQESAQKRADEAYAQLQADQAARQKNPQSPNLLSGAQRFTLAQEVQSAQGQANAHKARADALEQDEAEARAAADAQQSISEAQVTNQIAANRRLAESKRQDLENSLAIQQQTASVRIAGIADVQERARASAAVELAIAQQKADKQKVIDQDELKNYTALVNRRAAIANEGLTVKDYTAETTARGDIEAAKSEAADKAKALDQSVNVAKLKLGATEVTAEREWSEQVTRAWEEAWDKVKKKKDDAMLTGFAPAAIGFQASQAVTGTLDKGAGQQQELRIEGQKLTFEAAYNAMVLKTGADRIRLAEQLAALESQARQADIAGLQKDYGDKAQQMAQLPAGDDKRVEMARQLSDLYIKIGDERAKANNDDIAAANQIAALKQQQNLGYQLGQDLANTIQISLPQNLGNALASGIFGGGRKGEDVGTQVAKALKDTGKQLLGEGLTQIFEKLIAQVVAQTGLQAWFNAQFPATLTGQTSALIAAGGVNTTAIVSAITASAAAGAGVGAGASAGSAVAGSVASGASAAATGGLSAIAPIIGGVISGVMSIVGSLIGAHEIVRAVDGTTAAVNALRTAGFSSSANGLTTTTRNGSTNTTTSQNGTSSSGGLGVGGFMQGLFGLGDSNAIPVRIVQSWGDIFHQGLTAGVAGLLGFDDGGPVSRDMIAQVHGGEWVLNNDQVTGRAALPSFLAARFPTTRVNFPSTEDYMTAGGTAITSAETNTFSGNHTFHIYESSNAAETARQVSAILKTQIPRSAKWAR